MLFADVYDETSPNNNSVTLQEPKDLDFNLDDFASFNTDFKTAEEEQKTATIVTDIKEPAEPTPTPALETTKVVVEKHIQIYLHHPNYH